MDCSNSRADFGPTLGNKQRKQMITITIRFVMTYASILAHSGNSKGLYPMIMGKKVNELISKAMMQMTLRMAPEARRFAVVKELEV